MLIKPLFSHLEQILNPALNINPFCVATQKPRSNHLEWMQMTLLFTANPIEHFIILIIWASVNPANEDSLTITATGA